MYFMRGKQNYKMENSIQSFVDEISGLLKKIARNCLVMMFTNTVLYQIN